MKFFLTLTLFFCILSAYGQESADTSHLHLKYKIGFYKTYEEFIKDSPSTTRQFKIVERSQSSQFSFGGGTHKYILDSNEQSTGRIWGVTDGKDIYVCFNQSSLWKLEFVGRYSFYYFLIHSGLFKAPTIKKEIRVIDEKGKVHIATKKYLEKLFAAIPSIQNEFSNDIYTPETAKEYLIRFNKAISLK